MFTKAGSMTSEYSKMDHPAVLRVLFHPRRQESPPPAGAVDLTLRMADEIRLGARFFPAAEAALAPILLFFHGNGEIAGDYDELGLEFAGEGVNFLAVDYRGYGLSEGLPSASTMLADAHAVLQEGQGWLNASGCAGPLLVMGRSLGSVSAIELMATHQEKLAGLVIDSGFAFTMPLLANLGLDLSATALSEADGFKNQLKISLVRKPTFILHGQQDQIIPVASAEVLQARCGARSKEFVIVPGADHNTIFERTGPLYCKTICRFIKQALRTTGPRKRPGVRER
jgi:alpha-beta hydrolase superfamily lysophospholipase